MERLSNWELILSSRLLKDRSIAFKYGINDCTTWTASVVSEYTDLIWTPYWKDKKEAIEQQNSSPMEDQVSEVLGQYSTNLTLAKRGDVVQKGTGMDAALGICIGNKAIFLYKKGLCYVDLVDCIYIWRI